MLAGADEATCGDRVAETTAGCPNHVFANST